MCLNLENLFLRGERSETVPEISLFTLHVSCMAFQFCRRENHSCTYLFAGSAPVMQISLCTVHVLCLALKPFAFFVLPPFCFPFSCSFLCCPPPQKCDRAVPLLVLRGLHANLRTVLTTKFLAGLKPASLTKGSYPSLRDAQ